MIDRRQVLTMGGVLGALVPGDAPGDAPAEGVASGIAQMSDYDWHMRLQQPLVLGRDANGRYTMMLGFTALVLRQDAVANFIGIPYDNR